MRMRKKPHLKTRMEKCAGLIENEPEKHRGRWLVDYSNGEPFEPQTESGREKKRFSELHIELGCGKGHFTVETAKSVPGILIAALEKSADAMVIALERAAALNLHNVRFINALAERLADYFASGEVSRIYINFCDPWPSNRHVKRRLTNRRFLDTYLQILRPGGEIHFKTDNASLFDYSLREFEYCGFEPVEVTRDLHKNGPSGVMTDYECKFFSQGLPIHKAIMRK